MHKVQLIIKLLLQLGIIIVITYIGTEIQKIFHLPLAGSIVGLFLFYLLLFFAVIIIGTCIVALSSGYIAEKMSVKHKHRKGVDAYE